MARSRLTQGPDGVDPEEAAHLFRMAQHHDERDRSAPVVGDQLHLVDAQAIQTPARSSAISFLV